MLVIGWGTGEVVEYPLLRPPAPLLDTTSGSIHEGLTMSLYPKSYIACLHALVVRILDSAEVGFELFGSDGAYSNLRLLAHLGHARHHALQASPEKEGTLFDSSLCMNHRAGLVEGSAVAMMTLKCVATLYATSCFLHMGNHFSRLVLSSDFFASKIAVRARSTPPQFAKDYNEELLSYFRDNHKREKGLHSRKFVKLGAEDTGRHATQIAARFLQLRVHLRKWRRGALLPDPQLLSGFQV